MSTVGGASLSGDSNGASVSSKGSASGSGSGKSKSAGGSSAAGGSGKSTTAASSGGSAGSGSGKTASSGGSAAAAGGGGKTSAAMSGAGASSGSAGKASTHVRALAGKDGHMDGESGSFYDGYYSYSSKQCPVCEYRSRARALADKDGGDAAEGGGEGQDNGPAGHGKGHGGGGDAISHVGGSANMGKHDVKASASHYVNGHMSGLTNADVDEHSSFDDGFAVYARFFKPYAITVRGDGSVLWVADAGNNRIRNISCAGIGAPTFDPTAEPTKRPTLNPSAQPTVKPTEEPTLKPSSQPVVIVAKASQAPAVVGVVIPKAGKNGPVDGVPGQATKSPVNKAVKGASMGDAGSGVTGLAAHLSSTEVAVISVCAFVAAVCLSLILYNRQRIINFIISETAAPVKKLALPTSEFGMGSINVGV